MWSGTSNLICKKPCFVMMIVPLVLLKILRLLLCQRRGNEEHLVLIVLLMVATTQDEIVHCLCSDFQRKRKDVESGFKIQDVMI